MRESSLSHSLNRKQSCFLHRKNSWHFVALHHLFKLGYDRFGHFCKRQASVCQKRVDIGKTVTLQMFSESNKPWAEWLSSLARKWWLTKVGEYQCRMFRNVPHLGHGLINVINQEGCTEHCTRPHPPTWGHALGWDCFKWTALWSNPSKKDKRCRDEIRKMNIPSFRCWEVWPTATQGEFYTEISSHRTFLSMNGENLR